MKILLTNNGLQASAGTELYLKEVATELQSRGHEPACFTLRPGEIGDQLIALGIPVSDDLRALPGPPDIIHGQHLIETTLAAMTYRTVPVVSFCHGPEAWQESACRLPNVVQWVAVDAACYRRLVEDEGIAPAKLLMLLNHFDDRRYQPRTPLPDRPRKALMVSNRLTEDHPATRAAKAACRTRGISLDFVGNRFGKRSNNLEQLLPQYDIVFAKARCAIEAMGVGCAVVQLDYFGSGRLVTGARFDELRALNFGYRSMTFPLCEKHLGAEIDQYDPQDAAIVSKRIREEATLDRSIDALLAVYTATLAHAPTPDYDPALAAADFLRFHAFLSKLPFEGLRKRPGTPLRLPCGPIPPGEVQSTWEKIAAPHIPRPASLKERLISRVRQLFR